MSVRLFHRGARLVLVMRRRAPGDETWWAPHFTAPDWQAIFSVQARLLGLTTGAPAAPGRLDVRLGEINWITASHWSMITLHLRAGSDVKRRLVAAALLKAARYARPG